MGSLTSGSSLFLLLLAGFLLLLGTLARAQTAQVPAVFLFGDSLADVGNNNYLPFSILKANFPHNGVDYPGHKATGRFSNGLNAADFIAQKVGLPTSPPYLSVRFKNTDVFFKGVSFASGGAGILSSTNKDHCITFDRQIDYYSIIYTSLLRQFGSAEAQNYFSKSLFVTVIGSNDMFGYLKSNQPKSSSQDFISSIVSIHNHQLRRLYNLGARKILVIGTPPIGCCPSQRIHNKTAECNAEANNLSVRLSEGVLSLLKGMESELAGMKYSFFNSTTTLLDYIQKPKDYGFVEVKSACCGLGNLNAKVACLPIATYCSNRDAHLFWDLYHPTEITTKMLVDLAFDGPRPYAFPINLKQLVAI